MALEGIKVLDLSRLLPGPFCTMLLADLGATIVRVEDPNGDFSGPAEKRRDGFAAGFANLDRNKQSICLNLKEPAGKEILLKLARDFDVLLEGFRPGVMDRLGLGYSHLSAINPRLVYCSLSGYGQDGPYRLKVGHDINYLSIAGALGMTGPYGGPPVMPAVQVADVGGGALMAATGILTALLARQRTGKGQFVDIAMADGVAAWMFSYYGSYLMANSALRRGEGQLSGGMAYYQIYRTKDDKYLSLGAVEAKFWSNFCQIIGKPELADDHAAPPARQREMMQIVGDVIATRTRGEWVELFGGREVCVEPVYDIEEAVADPQLLHRQMIVETDLPGEGKVKQGGIPIKLSDTPGSIRTPAVVAGYHTAAVLRQLGYTETEIEELARAGVINRPRGQKT
ncbi:MAG: CoA transferase [Chloroflexota bacterium]|nr:MAG: CoA transferase [Chloroflexota bacterium]